MGSHDGREQPVGRDGRACGRQRETMWNMVAAYRVLHARHHSAVGVGFAGYFDDGNRPFLTGGWRGMANLLRRVRGCRRHVRRIDPERAIADTTALQASGV